jgi:hypothetical protein
VYFTGLSLGGRGVYSVIKDLNLNTKAAALVVIAAQNSTQNLDPQPCAASKTIGLWHFQGQNDNIFSLGNAQWSVGAVNQCRIPGYNQFTDSAINSATDPKAHAFSSAGYSAGWDIYYGYPNALNKAASTLTVWTGQGHGGWNSVYNNTHGGTSYGKDGVAYTDIYQWMMTYSLSLDGGVVDAGIRTDAGVDAGPIDAGVRADAGAPVDAGIRVDSGVPIDAGIRFDGGMRVDAGSQFDAGVFVDAGMPIDSMDGGGTPIDPVDAGPPIDSTDSGTPLAVDSGATMAMDSGSVVPIQDGGMGTTQPGQGCGCQSFEAGWLVLMLISLHRRTRLAMHRNE